jgi:hypothetical protein
MRTRHLQNTLDFRVDLVTRQWTCIPGRVEVDLRDRAFETMALLEGKVVRKQKSIPALEQMYCRNSDTSQRTRRMELADNESFDIDRNHWWRKWHWSCHSSAAHISRGCSVLGGHKSSRSRSSNEDPVHKWMPQTHHCPSLMCEAAMQLDA